MAEKTLSFCQGKGSLSHNNRTFSAKNVNSERSKDNVVFIKLPIGQAYSQCFDSAIDKYNSKQKRVDRKIKGGYFEYAFDTKPCNTVVTAADKRKSFYEDVVYIGTKDDTGVGTADAKVSKQCLIEYMEGFSKRNPNFFVFNAVLHMDEATPHLHIDYIPLAHCKRGLDTQNGIAQALREMGFGEGKDAINRWRLSERKVITEICRNHGITISKPQEARGSFAVEEYKKFKDTISELNQQKKKAEIKKNNAEKAVNVAEQKLAKLSKVLNEKELSQIDVTPKKLTGGFKGLSPDEAQKMKNTAEKALEYENLITLLKEKIAGLEKQNEALQQRLSPISPQNMKIAKEKADLENQIRILKKAIGISNANNYDEVVRQLKQKGLLQPNSLNFRKR